MLGKYIAESYNGKKSAMVHARYVTLQGRVVAEPTVEALEKAGPNLTQESVVEGAEAIRDWYCPAHMVPVNLSPTDHRPFEIEVYHRVENGRWVEFGEPINSESTPGKVIGCKGVGQPIYAGGGE